jgi:hypothetical protein
VEFTLDDPVVVVVPGVVIVPACANWPAAVSALARVPAVACCVCALRVSTEETVAGVGANDLVDAVPELVEPELVDPVLVDPVLVEPVLVELELVELLLVAVEDDEAGVAATVLELEDGGMAFAASGAAKSAAIASATDAVWGAVRIEVSLCGWMATRYRREGRPLVASRFGASARRLRA